MVTDPEFENENEHGYYAHELADHVFTGWMRPFTLNTESGPIGGFCNTDWGHCSCGKFHDLDQLQVQFAPIYRVTQKIQVDRIINASTKA